MGCFNSLKNLILMKFSFLFSCGVFSIAEGGDTVPKTSSLTPYEEAMEALSSLITRRTRADSTNMGDQFNVMFEYLKVIKFVN